MASTCPKGQIRRKAYTRKDGTHVKSTCVPDKGLPGKTPARRKVLPIPVKGNLSKYGYDNVKNTPAAKRHAALRKGVEDAGYATIIQRINLVANYNKNSDPKVHKIMRSDIKWIQDNLYQYSKSYRDSHKASRKTSRKASRKTAAKKTSRKASRKTSRKAAAKKTSRKASRKVSRKASKKMIKAGKMMVGDRERQLYRVPKSAKTFYRYRKADGTLGKRYV